MTSYLKVENIGGGELAKQLRALVALLEETGLISSIHMGAHRTSFDSVGTRYTHGAHIHKQGTHTHKIGRGHHL